MKLKVIILILSTFIISNCFACDCECVDDCSFYRVSNNAGFVAIVKMISYDDFLNDNVIGYNGKMPYSMTVEIIKKYKGTLTQKRVKIWGDNGALCRPYISNFKIGDFYLIAPHLLGDSHQKGEESIDYDFNSCATDYLNVDFKKGLIYGKYTSTINELKLVEFERKLKK